MGWQAVEGSFRDPSGFVYSRDGTLYRQINTSFRQSFEAFLASGLYDELVRDGLLVPHEQVGLELAATNDACAVIRPQRIAFISYPYEWSFSQLKDAALLTLRVQKAALRHMNSIAPSTSPSKNRIPRICRRRSETPVFLGHEFIASIAVWREVAF